MLISPSLCSSCLGLKSSQPLSPSSKFALPKQLTHPIYCYIRHSYQRERLRNGFGYIKWHGRFRNDVKIVRPCALLYVHFPSKFPVQCVSQWLLFSGKLIFRVRATDKYINMWCHWWFCQPLFVVFWHPFIFHPHILSLSQGLLKSGAVVWVIKDKYILNDYCFGTLNHFKGHFQCK